MSSTTNLIRRLEAEDGDAKAIASKVAAIHERVVSLKPHLLGSNVNRLGADDLGCFFQAIDDIAFHSLVGSVLKEQKATLSFRLGKRMTSSGGTTTKIVNRRAALEPARYEIAVAPRLLFTTFQLAPAAMVCGCECRNLAEALQRIMEHEVIHLLEMLVWGKSSCHRQRFRDIARRLFGHQSSNHSLVTPAKIAADVYDIRVGDRVRFEFNGQVLSGVVNRITQRATVLVRDDRGQRYSDGHRYRKFYVPMKVLQRVR